MESAVLRTNSKEESNDLATGVLATCFFMCHDTVRCRHYKMSKLTRRQDICRQLLNLWQRHIEAGRDDAALVDPADEVHDNLSRAMVIHNFKVADVSVLL